MGPSPDSIPSSQGQRATCHACGASLSANVSNFSAYPAGVKFEPTDEQLMMHLLARLGTDGQEAHPDLDKFIPTLYEEDGICGLHPDLLPDNRRDGTCRHYFNRPAPAYTSGTRKRRKIQIEEDGEVKETRWHKTGRTKRVVVMGKQVGWKKILVMYDRTKTAGGGWEKDVKTNWVMHQYHVGSERAESEWVVSKVFWQIQPRQCAPRKPAAGKGEQVEEEEEEAGAEPEPEADHGPEPEAWCEAGGLSGAMALDTAAGARAGRKRKAAGSVVTVALDVPIGGGGSGGPMDVISVAPVVARKKVQLARGVEPVPMPRQEMVTPDEKAAGPDGDLGLPAGQALEDALHLSEVGSSQGAPDCEDGEGAVSDGKAAAAGRASDHGRSMAAGAAQPVQWGEERAMKEVSHGNLLCREADLNCLEDSEVEDQRQGREGGQGQEAGGGGERAACPANGGGPAGGTGSQEPPDSQGLPTGSAGGPAWLPVDFCAFADGLICTPTEDPHPPSGLLDGAPNGTGQAVKETRDFMAKFGESARQEPARENGDDQQQLGEGQPREGQDEETHSSQTSLDLQLNQPLPQIGSQDVNKFFEGLPTLSQMDSFVSQSQPQAEAPAPSEPAVGAEPRPQPAGSGSLKEPAAVRPCIDAEELAAEPQTQLPANGQVIGLPQEVMQLHPCTRSGAGPELQVNSSQNEQQEASPPRPRKQPPRDKKKLVSKPLSYYFSQSPHG